MAWAWGLLLPQLWPPTLMGHTATLSLANTLYKVVNIRTICRVTAWYFTHDTNSRVSAIFISTLRPHTSIISDESPLTLSPVVIRTVI
jgi:hypothetical protein